VNWESKEFEKLLGRVSVRRSRVGSYALVTLKLWLIRSIEYKERLNREREET
jgi:hypothetical protein